MANYFECCFGATNLHTCTWAIALFNMVFLGSVFSIVIIAVVFYMSLVFPYQCLSVLFLSLIEVCLIYYNYNLIKAINVHNLDSIWVWIVSHSFFYIIIVTVSLSFTVVMFPHYNIMFVAIIIFVFIGVVEMFTVNLFYKSELRQ